MADSVAIVDHDRFLQEVPLSQIRAFIKGRCFAIFTASRDGQIRSLLKLISSNRAGKQREHLAIPYSYNLGGWANLLIPICVIRNGDGPTVLLMAGNHGDEYPGQAASRPVYFVTCSQIDRQIP